MLSVDRMSGLKEASRVFCLCRSSPKLACFVRFNFLSHHSFFQHRLFTRPMASHGNQMRGGARKQQWRGKPKESVGFSNPSEAPTPRVSLNTDNAGRAEYRKSSEAASASQSSGAGNVVNGKTSSGLKGVWVPKASASPSLAQPLPVVEPARLVEGIDADAHVDVDVSKSPKMPQGDSGSKKGGMQAKAQPRATFYPKFENEKSDQEIRMKIIEVVSSGRGVLEVTLKHSGSLFMYSGDHGGAFAKNSYGNVYTVVGVFVLGRTLQKAWGQQASTKQQEFNAFLQKNNICISMELVTAVLDDHGQRPLQDYVVVTAVTELRGRPRFYTTPDLIAFCRQWRLPTNHVWLFSSRSSTSSFFAAYDALCEEGIASTVGKTLDEIADASVPATRSHVEVQGEILEGLVARVISPHSVDQLTSVLQEFSLVNPDEGSSTLGLGLREIYAANKQSEEKLIQALLQNVGRDFCSDWSDWTQKDAVDNNLLGSFLQASPIDNTTSKLQEMFRLIRHRKLPVRFRNRLISHGKEDQIDSITQFKTTVHVLADSAFRRYQKEMRNHPGLWPLYRGFFVEVSLWKHANALTSVNQQVDYLTNQISSQLTVSDTEVDMLADENDNLMLKLKFLPYKIRTFLIRNGLTTLFTNGPLGYKEYYSRLMKSWGTSVEKQRELSQLLNEWAKYITNKMKDKKLSGNTYLSKAEVFLKSYAERSPKNMRLVGGVGTLVDVDDFVKIAREEHEEDEINYEKEDKNVVYTDSKPTLPKAKGILVFFPGIPGCAKSALCKEILGSLDGLGDGRIVKSLMGDMIKGRYWQILSDDRKKKPSTITLADKNAPNVEVWKQIEDICQRTDAIGVPIVSTSEGTESNPFSLDALAVFVYRVLQRVNHPGNLDKNSPNPGYVLLMFYNLYEGKDRQEFEAELLGRFGHLVRMPLLKTDRPPLPTSVQNVLSGGLELYKRHAAKHRKLEPSKGSFKNDWEKWEKDLKDILFSNAKYLDAIQVPFQESVDDVKAHLHEIAVGNYGVHMPILSEERNFRSFTFVAISLPALEIINVLNKVANQDMKVKNYLQDKNLEETLKAVHVTLAHKRAHGVANVASYAMWRGSNIPVQLTAFLFSEKMCALEACLHSTDGGITSKNPWPHVTVWTAKETAAKEANSLPDLVHSGQATRTELLDPVTISGVLQFL